MNGIQKGDSGTKMLPLTKKKHAYACSIQEQRNEFHAQVFVNLESNRAVLHVYGNS